METCDMVVVMKAYDEGKQIQFRTKNTAYKWADCTSVPGWDWQSYEYRVKPENYRPYKNTKEFLEKFVAMPDMIFNSKFGGIWLRCKPIGGRLVSTAQITNFYDNSIIVGGYHYNYDEAFKEYTYEDGTVFGVKVGNDDSK